MSTIPSTIILMSMDKLNCPVKMIYVIVKQIFRYGVKDISMKSDKILIQLNYSPRESTLVRKFGDLPIKYLRTRLETEEEIRLFEKAMKKYKFNFDEDSTNEATTALHNTNDIKSVQFSSDEGKFVQEEYQQMQQQQQQVTTPQSQSAIYDDILSLDQ